MAEKDAKLQKTDVGFWSWLWSWCWWWWWSSRSSLSLNCPRPGRRQGDRLSEAILLAIWNEWGKIQLHQGPVQIGIIIITIIINNTIIIAIINNTAIVGVEGLFKPIRGGYPLILWTASVTTFPTQNRSLSSFALFHLVSILLWCNHSISSIEQISTTIICIISFALCPPVLHQ